MARFIPDPDAEFRVMANTFARTVAKDPKKYHVSDRDADLLVRKAKAFHDALSVTMSPSTRTPTATIEKNERRREAEEIIRRLGAVIRASPEICASDKRVVFVKERERKLRKGKCPIYPPLLKFEGVTAEGAGALHQLRVTPGYDMHGRQDREGAVRIELYCDLVAPGEEVPNAPGETWGNRPYHLGSFTKSPIRVKPLIPPTPMLVVYWARWADSSCRVGPWSKTCESRWEGKRLASQPTLGAMPIVKQLENDPKQLTVIEHFREEKLLLDERVEVKRLPDAA